MKKPEDFISIQSLFAVARLLSWLVPISISQFYTFSHHKDILVLVSRCQSEVNEFMT